MKFTFALLAAVGVAGSASDSLGYPDTLSNVLNTIERLPGQSAGLSVLGQNGAYESNPFANDTFGPAPDFQVNLIGSPGAIPAPGTVALFGLAGVRRRR